MSVSLVKFLIKNYNRSSIQDEEVYIETFGDKFKETICDRERFSIMLRHYQLLVIDSEVSLPEVEDRVFDQFTHSNSESILIDYIDDCINHCNKSSLFHKYRMMIDRYCRRLLECGNNYPKFQEILENLQRRLFNKYNDAADIALHQAMNGILSISIKDNPFKAKFHRNLLELSPKASFSKKLEAYLEALA
jgi:hypothetical protein